LEKAWGQKQVNQVRNGGVQGVWESHSDTLYLKTLSTEARWKIFAENVFQQRIIGGWQRHRKEHV
jgi:hypothetical protein